MNEFNLHEDRFFDSDETIRKAARELYDEIKDFPIVCPHGHVDPKIFVENEPFPNPAELFISPDHYVYRMLYSQGISLEDLDIPQKEEKSLEKIQERFGRYLQKIIIYLMELLPVFGSIMSLILYLELRKN